MTGLSILLPWPPSTNDLWRAVKLRGNIMSARYRDWVREAELALAVQPHHAVEGPVAIRFQLGPPDKRVYDPDNRIKAVMDFLHRNDLIDDDSNRTVRRIIIECDEGFVGVWSHIDPVAP